MHFRKLIRTAVLLSSFTMLPMIAAEAAMMKPQHAIEWKEFLGVNTFFHYTTPDLYTKQIDMLHDLGLVWIREGLHWAQLEPQEGRFDLAELDAVVKILEHKKLSPLFYLAGSAHYASSAPDNAPYFDKYPPKTDELYALTFAKLAQRYPYVHYWQAWNEPNSEGFWQPKPNPHRFMELTAASAAALKQAAPDDVFVMAGMAYFSQMAGTSELMLQTLAEKEGAFRHPWIVAYHPYMNFPERYTEQGGEFIPTVSRVNSFLKAAGATHIWATEWGWSSYTGTVEEQPLISEEQQADYILKRLSLMASQDFERVFLFSLADLDARASPRDRRYGLLREDASPKPAYTALKNFLSFSGATLRPTEPPALVHPSNEITSTSWKQSDGRCLWIFWGKNPSMATFKTAPHNAVLFNPLTGEKKKLDTRMDIFSLPITDTLQMLSYDAP